jgi:NAD(P)-dependent dehydrogenase (short-subunit alcohol dehydrogenase family)
VSTLPLRAFFNASKLLSMSSGPVGHFPLDKKIVVVTGGGSGIGLAFSILCHDHGARVIVGDLKLTNEGREFVDSVGDGSVRFTKCNVADWSDLRGLIDFSIAAFGDVPDVYAPVAGIFEPSWSNFWEDTETESYATMRINTDHPIRFTRLAFRALLGANKKGVVCLVSSGAGYHGLYISALYCASKHAVVGLARSLGPADEQEGVKVVCMCPGMVRSPLWTDRQDEKASIFGYDAEKGTGPPDLMPEVIAKSMVDMVVDESCKGGAILSKRPDGEEWIEKGGPQFYELKGNFVQDILRKERGLPWEKHTSRK